MQKYINKWDRDINDGNDYYAYGLKIAGISSKKLGDVNEGQLKNQHLYNDKELWEEADLNWYDYGFRNYDAQIGRFPQLDPLTDGYPGLTPYQYASCEPIANIDMDGLEALVSNVATSTFNAVQTLQDVTVFATKTIVPFAAKIAAPSLTTLLTFGNISLKAASTALSVGKNLNTNKPGLDGINITFSANTTPKPSSPNWLQRTSNGKGSTQGDGYTFSGNSTGTSSEFKDHGENNSGSVNMGSAFDIANIFRSSISPLKARPNTDLVLKYIKWHDKVLQTTYKISEETKKGNTGNIDEVFKKKGSVVYNRDGGNKTRNTDGKGGGETIYDPNVIATDTFPKEKGFGFPYPIQ